MISINSVRPAGLVAVLLCTVLLISCSKTEQPEQDNYSSGWAVGNRFNNVGLLMRSSDRGLSWERLSPFLVEGVDLYDVETVSDKEAWVVGGKKDSIGFIMYTMDGGGSWTRSGMYLMVPYVNLRDVCVKNNVIWIAGDNGTVLKSADHGFMWQQAMLGDIPVADYTCISARGNSIWIGGTVTDTSTRTQYGIVICSRNGGITWSRLAPGEILPVGISDIQAFSDSAVYVSGWEEVKGSHHSGESEWNTFFYKPGVMVGGLCVTSLDDIWLGASDQTVYHVGPVYDSIHSPYHGSCFRGMTGLSASHIWACGSYDNSVVPLVLSTNTGGKSWFSGKIESSGVINRVSFMNDLK